MRVEHDDPPALRRLSAFDDPRAPGPDPATVPEGSPGWQMAWSFPFPGLATMRRRPLAGLLLFVVGVLAPMVLVAWVFARRSEIIGLALDPRFLTLALGLGLALILVRLLAIMEIAHAFRRAPGIGGTTFVAVLVVAVLASPVVWGVLQLNAARGIVGDVFASGSGEPVYDSGSGDPNVETILLIGGDAGPGRWGMRTDTMILVIADRASGRTALVSIPRNLTSAQFPPGTPLADRFPGGFDDLANAIFTEVNSSPDLTAAYGIRGLQPEAMALAGAIGYSLDITIDDFALVNMGGFADLIDAVGGVTLELATSVELPPSPPDQAPVPEWIGPGVIEMDGPLAVAYVRTRYADSDYQRMGRQRQLLAALGSQVSPADALAGFGSVTGVLDDSMRTSLSAGEFSNLLDLLGDNSAIVESVGLAPPLIQPGSPSYGDIRAIIDAVERAVVTGTPSGYAT